MSKGAYKEYGVLSHYFKHRQEAVSLTLGWNIQIPGNNWSQEHSKQAVLRRKIAKKMLACHCQLGLGKRRGEYSWYLPGLIISCKLL